MCNKYNYFNYYKLHNFLYVLRSKTNYRKIYTLGRNDSKNEKNKQKNFRK